MLQRVYWCNLYRGAVKSLVRPGNSNCVCQMCDGQRDGLIWVGKGQVLGFCECGNGPTSSINCWE